MRHKKAANTDFMHQYPYCSYREQILKTKAKIANATKQNAEAGNKDVVGTLGGSTCINPELTNNIKLKFDLVKKFKFDRTFSFLQPEVY